MPLRQRREGEGFNEEHALAHRARIARGGGCGRSGLRRRRVPAARDCGLEILPGPGRVTYDEQIAYRATFETNSKSTLNKVKARITVPVAEGVEASPLPESHTCPSTPEIRQIADGPDEWACDFGTVVRAPRSSS